MWLIPSKSCRSTPEAECLTKPSPPDSIATGSTRAFWDSSSGKPSRRGFSWPGWKRRRWSAILFGERASKVWTPDLCADTLICSPRRRPASPTAAPGSAAETQTNGATATETGRSFTQSESSKSVDPPWSSSRMFRSGLQADIFGNSASNFAEWVMTSRRRCLSLRKTLALRTKENGCSSLDGWQTPSKEQFSSRRQVGQTEREELLPAQARNWATAQAHDIHPRGKGNRMNPNGGNACLASDAMDWIAPAGVSGDHGADGSEAAQQAKRWPSARAADSELAGNHPDEDQLPNSVATWPAPTEADGHRGSLTMMRGNDTLKGASVKFPSSRPDETTTAAGMRSLLAVWTRPSCPRLSPAFQWWLMGFPSPIQTCFDSAAMRSFRRRLRSHLRRCLGSG